MVTKNENKKLKRGLFLIVLCIITILIIYFDVARIPDLITKLSYFVFYINTALIAILFSILAIHLPRQYGLISVDFLLKKSRNIVVFYFLNILIALPGIVLDFNTFKLPLFTIIDITINPVSIILAIEIIIAIITAYSFQKYLLEIFHLSPKDIMKQLGYPEKILIYVQKGKFHQTKIQLNKGLSLIRICILDMSMRDELESVVLDFNNIIEKIPWHEEKEKQLDKKDINIEIFFDLHRNIEEYIIDSIINIELKPSLHMFSPFFHTITKVYINTGMVKTSLFVEHLDRLYRVTENYVIEGKKEALESFFFQPVFFVFDANLKKISYKEVSLALSEGLTLSTSLIRAIGSEKRREVNYISFILFTFLQQWLQKYPRAFTSLTDIDNLVYFIEKGGRFETGEIIIILFYIEKELPNLEKVETPYEYIMTTEKITKIKSKIVNKLKSNQWRVFIRENNLNILDINDNTIGAKQLKGMVNENEVEAFNSYIQRYFGVV